MTAAHLDYKELWKFYQSLDLKHPADLARIKSVCSSGLVDKELIIQPSAAIRDKLATKLSPHWRRDPSLTRIYEAAIALYAKAGFVRKVSSDFALCYNDVLVLPKKTGQPRLILNGKPCNHFIERTTFTLPSFFSAPESPFLWAIKLDFSNAFTHWTMSENLQRLTCFTSPNGDTYCWERLAWGTSCAPEIMQFMMEPFCYWIRTKLGCDANIFYDDLLVTCVSKVQLAEVG